MRKSQNIVSNFGNVVSNAVIRQGNLLVVRLESSRSLRALSSTLRTSASLLASWLSDAVWQGQYLTCTKSRVGTATCFAMAISNAVVTRDQRRHLIMCHRTAA